MTVISCPALISLSPLDAFRHVCLSLQVILNSPKLIEEEKAKMASKEKALKEKEGQKPANKTANTVNGTGGTPIHVNTLQVNTPQLNV